MNFCSFIYRKYFFTALCAGVLFCVAANSANGQESVKVSWGGTVKKVSNQGRFVEALYCQDGSNNEADGFLPVLNLSKSGQVDQVSITNEVYEALSASEQKFVNTQVLQSLVPWRISRGTFKGGTVSNIAIRVLRINSAGITERLLSFDLSYSIVASQPQARVSQTQATGYTSVLSSGQWYKIGVTRSGLHKIDKAFLQKLGISASGIDPRSVRLYGNGGEMLPQENSSFRYDDLQENAIWVSGEADGVFNDDDYVVFNAKGPHNLIPDTVGNTFSHRVNIYSDTAFYFITYGQGNGLRIATATEAGGSVINIGDNAFFQEDELVNLGHSGRAWFGTSIASQATQNFNFSMQDIVPNSGMPISIGVASAFRSGSSVSFDFTLNGSFLGSSSISGGGSGPTDPVGGGAIFTLSTANSSLLNGSSSALFTIKYNGNGIAGATGYLDYIRVNFKQYLNMPVSQQLAFQSFTAKGQGSVTYQINNAVSGARVWDVTNPLRPVEMTVSQAGTVMSVNASANKFRRFVAFGGGGYSTPISLGLINNQNLHANGSSNLLIVTVPAFVSAANRLADFRRSQGISTSVITTNQIYNEFSSGAQDITAIRDYVKMLFQRSSGVDSLKYILLFGGASYDYKSRLANNTNFVPVYQSRESFNQIDSYSSDDYIGFMDNNEGFWPETHNTAQDMLDLAIGRIPVKNIQEASLVVDKLIKYASNTASLGKWRNKITFVADDGDGARHSDDANNVATQVNKGYPLYNTDKLFLDFYVQEATATGQRSPEIIQAINDAVNTGTLIMNYTGHGREVGWASENIVSMDQIAAWTNADNLPFFVTATCDFGRYDDPTIYSGGMSVLLTGNTAGIGSLSTTRIVYAYSNLNINQAFYSFVFQQRNGKWPLMGDVVMRAKNKSAASIQDINNRNFTLLGDPSFRLNYAENDVLLTKYNSLPLTSGKDTVSALQKVSFEGEVRNQAGTLMTDFNGLVNVTYYDKPVNVITRGDEDNTIRTYPVRKNFIFEGQSTATNGKFSFTFVVPKDIAYQYGFGKISLYAAKQGTLIDAGGVNDSIILGGTAKNAAKDNTPPLVKLYMNDSSFVFGGVTGNPAQLIVNLSDENGINVAGTGIGHEITATLNNNTQKPIVLNQFYSSAKDDYTKGVVSYKLSDLSQGRNSLRVKAWDTYNNSGEGYIEFIVANNESVALEHVLNYPNPFSQNTTFHFDHNREGDDLDVMVQIFTVSGILVKTINMFYPAAKSHIGDIQWNARDDFGDRIGNGVYIYKVSVKAARDGNKAFQFQKLVLLN